MYVYDSYIGKFLNRLFFSFQRAVDTRVAESWALREKIKHFSVSVMNRGELAEPLGRKLFHFNNDFANHLNVLC